MNIFPTRNASSWGGYVGITRAPRTSNALVSVGFSAFLDAPHVRKKLNHATEWVFAKTGGYVMQAIRRTIRAPKKYIKERRVKYYGETYYIDVQGRGYYPRYTKWPGWVFNWDIYKEEDGNIIYAKKEDAAEMVADFFAMRKLDGAGKPPRRGPTDLLRKFILFGYHLDHVLIGPHIFTEQPPSITARNTGNSVPDLLESGGTTDEDKGFGEYQAEYLPHPYVEPKRKLAEAKFRQNIGLMHSRLDDYGRNLRNRQLNKTLGRILR